MNKTNQIWRSMRTRCRNPKNRDYPRYGGRGIYVDSRWDSFQRFIEDMGEAPPGMSLDRIDNDGPYSPENCRWATPAQQNRNKRVNVLFEVDGELLCQRDCEIRLGLAKGAIGHRIKRHGWPPKLAATVEKIRK